MVEPLIFITTITIKEGKLEDFKHYSEEMGVIEANEPVSSTSSNTSTRAAPS